jgi:GNAT superfamily N-acetyltransferase
MSSTATPSRITYRYAEERELPHLAALKTRVYGGAEMDTWMRRWAWEFVQHPGKEPGAPASFVVAELDGKVVGGIGWIPTTLAYGGQVHPAAFGCDLFIDPDAQGHGLGKSLIDQVWPRFPISFWMNFDIHGARSYGKRGFASVEPLGYTVMLADPGSYLRTRGRAALGSALGWTRWPVGLFSRLRAARFRLPRGITLQEVTAFDAGFDRFHAERLDPGEARPRRDAAYLAWRYLDCPFGPYRIRAARRGETLVGYVIYRPRPRRTGRIGAVTELEADPRVPGLAEALLALAVKDLLGERVDFIRAFPTDPEARRVFSRLGFIDARRTPYCYVSPGSLEKLGIPQDGRRWRMSLGDCDLDYS